MTTVLAEKEFLDLLIYLMIGLGLALAVTIGTFIYVEFRRTPLEAKKVREASNKRRPLVIVEGDDGTVEFQVGYKRRPEGVLETVPQGKKPKIAWTGLIARGVKIQKPEANQTSTNGGTPADQDLSQVAEVLSDQATTHGSLRGAKIPVLFGYHGKAILTRIGHIASYQILERIKIHHPDLLATVDFTTLKTLFEMPWDETQLDAQAQAKYNEGFAAGRRGEDRNREIKILLMLMFGIFGMAALAVLIYKFL